MRTFVVCLAWGWMAVIGSSVCLGGPLLNQLTANRRSHLQALGSLESYSYEALLEVVPDLLNAVRYYQMFPEEGEFDFQRLSFILHNRLPAKGFGPQSVGYHDLLSAIKENNIQTRRLVFLLAGHLFPQDRDFSRAILGMATEDPNVEIRSLAMEFLGKWPLREYFDLFAKNLTSHSSVVAQAEQGIVSYCRTFGFPDHLGLSQFLHSIRPRFFVPLVNSSSRSMDLARALGREKLIQLIGAVNQEDKEILSAIQSCLVQISGSKPVQYSWEQALSDLLSLQRISPSEYPKMEWVTRAVTGRSAPSYLKDPQLSSRLKELAAKTWECVCDPEWNEFFQAKGPETPALMIGTFGHELIPHLITGLEDQRVHVQTVAAKSLGMIGMQAKASLTNLKTLLVHPNDQVAKAAILAIPNVDRDGETAGQLFLNLSSPHSQIAIRSLELLMRLTLSGVTSEMVDVLMAFLALHHDESGRVVQVLKKIAAHDVRWKDKYLGHPDGIIRRSVLETIVADPSTLFEDAGYKMKTPISETLIQSYFHLNCDPFIDCRELTNRSLVANSLHLANFIKKKGFKESKFTKAFIRAAGIIGFAEREILMEMVKTAFNPQESDEVRAEAISMALSLDASVDGVIPGSIGLLKNGSSPIKWAIIKNLPHIRPPPFARTLILPLLENWRGPDFIINSLIVDAMVTMAPASTDALGDILKVHDRPSLPWALITLERIGPSASRLLEPVKSYLKDSDPLVRMCAARAVEQLDPQVQVNDVESPSK